MGPGEDKLHAFPAQKLSLAQKAKDLDLEELAEHALIPSQHRVPDTAAVPSPRCHERVQVWVKPNSLAECMLDDRHRRSYTRSSGHLDEPRDCPVGRSRELGHKLSVIMEEAVFPRRSSST